MATANIYATTVTNAYWTNPNRVVGAADDSFASIIDGTYSYNYSLTVGSFNNTLPSNAIISSVSACVVADYSNNSGITFKLAGTAVPLTSYTTTYKVALGTVIPSTVSFTAKSNFNTFSAWVDTIYLEVVYTANVAVPVISTVSYTKTKISGMTGMTTSTVVFKSDVNLLQWEARAGGSGVGQGLLVGSGTTVTANTNTSFDVDYTELTQGDQTYRINIYGNNSAGWSTYG